MGKKPYSPTRQCPHRWCKPLHLVPLPFCLAVFTFQLWNNWIFLVTFAFGIPLAIWLPKIVHFKKQPRGRPVTVKDVVQDLRESPSAMDLAMEDARYEGTGWRVLEVRKWWARVAVGCDMIFVAVVGLSATSVFASPGEASASAADARLGASMFIGLAITAVFFGFMMYAHKKATQPRKPKRAWLPASLRPTS